MGFRLLSLFVFLTAIFTALGLLIGFLIPDFGGPVFFGFVFFVLSMVINFTVQWSSSRIILRRYHAKPSEDKELDGVVEKMALNAKIPKPKVYILPIDVPNSFAVGRSKEKASICVTKGLLDMNKGEKESVISHEMWHIANNDIKIQGVTAVIANILRFTIVLIPLAILLVKLVIPEAREYRADYYGSRFSKKPRDMTSALRKIGEVAIQNPIGGSQAFECLWIVNPFSRKGLSGMFSTHPPTARRATRIEEMDHEGLPEPFESVEV